MFTVNLICICWRPKGCRLIEGVLFLILSRRVHIYPNRFTKIFVKYILPPRVYSACQSVQRKRKRKRIFVFYIAFSGQTGRKKSSKTKTRFWTKLVLDFRSTNSSYELLVYFNQQFTFSSHFFLSNTFSHVIFICHFHLSFKTMLIKVWLQETEISIFVGQVDLRKLFFLLDWHH